MRYDKKISTSVTFHKKDGSFIGNVTDSFEGLYDIKNYARLSFHNRGILMVSVSQDGGYHKSFNVNTNL